MSQVMMRGPRSRAGLIAYPELAPNDMPMAKTPRPMISGAMFAFGGRFIRSTTAKMMISRKAVPTTSVMNGPQ
jgi:hypothetical protein